MIRVSFMTCFYSCQLLAVFSLTDGQLLVPKIFLNPLEPRFLPGFP